MRLLAHNRLGTEAIVQLEDGGPAYECAFAVVDTYRMIVDPEGFVINEEWVHDEPEPFETLGQVKKYLVTHAAMYDAALPE